MKPTDRALYSGPSSDFIYFPDQAVAELGFAGQFAVWAIRVQWNYVGTYSDERSERSLVLQRAFDVLGIPEGSMLVASLAEALAQCSSKPLSVPCPSWRVLTHDEAKLLNFLAALQDREGLAVCDAEWRNLRGSSAVWAPAQRLALAFDAAGLHFSMTRMIEPAAPVAMPLLH